MTIITSTYSSKKTDNQHSMKRPDISIVTPSYNQGRYIEDAIVSIKEQMGDLDVEHIIIDNCSDDITAEVAAKYPHVTFISEPDEGQSDAINKGFLKARGEIIGWLNADDYYMPNTLEKVMGILANESIDGIYSNVRFVNGENEFTRNLVVHKPLKWLSLFHCYIPSTSFFFRRKIIDDGVLIDKDMHISMDKDFFANILHKGYNIKFINDFFASFRWHESNKSLPTKENNLVYRKEGLIIFNRYSRFNFRITPKNVKRYAFFDVSLLSIRKLLKFTNGFYGIDHYIKSK